MRVQEQQRTEPPPGPLLVFFFTRFDFWSFFVGKIYGFGTGNEAKRKFISSVLFAIFLSLESTLWFSLMALTEFE
jgi:hypothetical protein